MRKLNLKGKQFGRLKVLSECHSREENDATFWTCLCSCGNTVIVRTHSLRDGAQSCGCFQRERASEINTTHGEHKHRKTSPEMKAYRHAKNRCNNPKDKSYTNYGGRGIEFRFTSFEEFLSHLGRKPGPEYSLDRIDNNGHYEPGNVRWATTKEQYHNRRVKLIEDFTTEELLTELEKRQGEANGKIACRLCGRRISSTSDVDRSGDSSLPIKDDSGGSGQSGQELLGAECWTGPSEGNQSFQREISQRDSCISGVYAH